MEMSYKINNTPQIYMSTEEILQAIKDAIQKEKKQKEEQCIEQLISSEKFLKSKLVNKYG